MKNDTDRERLYLAIPYAVGRTAKLEAMFPMTEEEWQQMLDVLAAMKPSLVTSHNPDEEAHP